jgi:hypothetical protein
MNLKQSCVWGLLLVLACCACGHPRRAQRASDEPPSTSVNALQPEPSAEAAAESAGETLAASSAECIDEECPDLMLLGALAPGCCQLDGSCGGRVQVAERTQLCVPPSVQDSTGMLQETLSVAAQEPYVEDRTCPMGILDGSRLPGCCRAVGRCGLYTEAWTQSAAAYGFELPAACLDAREAATLVDAHLADAGPPQRCARPAN